MRNAILIAVAAVLGFGIVFFMKGRESAGTSQPDLASTAAPPAPSPVPAPSKQTGSTSAATPVAAAPGSPSTPSAVTTSTATSASSPNYRSQVANATDMLPVVKSLFQRAQSGDGAAQYWLAKALAHCGDRNTRTPECQALHASPENFGNASDWIALSAGAGYPLGQVEQAAAQITTARVNRDPDADARLAESKKLAVTALRSGDPEVIMQASRVTFLLNNPTVDNYQDASSAAQPWRIAACMRGADCSPQSDWVRDFCRDAGNCQPGESGLDLLRRSLGSRYDEVERQARDINAKIDAGDWKSLNLE